MNIINTPVIDFHSHVGRMGNYNIIDDSKKTKSFYNKKVT